MESRALKRLVAVVAIVVAAAAGTFLWLRRDRDPNVGIASAPAVLSNEAERVRVEVLNTTDVRGLARRATFALRAAGFDVVRFGSDDGGPRDSTLVLDRSGHREWAERVARALGGARVESRPDSSRFLDVTVLLGADWRPPAKPFYP